MLISHRGNDNHKYKENTKKAIMNVLNKDYIDGVEFDIRITKDKQFVLNHSMFNNNKIIKYTLFKNLNLDSLDNVLKSIKSQKILLIEIKDNDEKIVNLLYKKIKRYKNLNIYIHTFHKNIANTFKQRYPQIKVGIILFNLDKDYAKYDFVSLNHLNYKFINKPIFLWTVNKKIKGFNSLNIITDKPFIFK